MLLAVTDRGLVRETNEDAVLARRLPDGAAALAVADGVGGAPGGEVASALAIGAVASGLDAAPPGADPADALVDAAREADRRVRAGQTGAHAGMCTTLVAAVVREGRAWVANVGDSRAYACVGETIAQLTTDHSWVGEELQAGRLRPDDPRVASHRHVVTRVIGGTRPLVVDRFGPITLARGDALLLCSDGLHGYVPDAAIAAALTPRDAGAADRLVALALAAGGVDNVTVALFVED